VLDVSGLLPRLRVEKRRDALIKKKKVNRFLAPSPERGDSKKKGKQVVDKPFRSFSATAGGKRSSGGGRGGRKRARRMKDSILNTRKWEIDPFSSHAACLSARGKD